jgi:hypothetical protein
MDTLLEQELDTETLELLEEVTADVEEEASTAMQLWEYRKMQRELGSL